MKAVRRFVLLLLPVALVVSSLSWGFSVVAPAGQDTTAQAATGSDFDPGYIISDENFYDADALSASEIQSFLNEQVPSCDTWHSPITISGVTYSAPFTCLKDYRTTIVDNAASAYCGFIPGGNYSAAEVIDKVARSCGVSQKVLLVLLQKEQSLVTDTWPAQNQYDRATGYACPDSGPNNSANCNAEYYGFFNQVYMAAWQFKHYQATASTRDAYRAGAWNSILYSPYTDRNCGAESVYIQNQATAGLYVYTPYVPNQAALNNLYGTGDSCSSYGNRNFWRLYTDWFGDTTGYSTHGAIGGFWTSAGGATGSLGYPTGNEIQVQGGVSQTFQGGTVWWNASSGNTFMVHGAILTSYSEQNWERGALGYPLSNEICGLQDGGCYQTFEGGQIHWSPNSGATLDMTR